MQLIYLGIMVLILSCLSQNQKTEPISGISSEGYTGKGMVQSKPRKGPPPSDDEE